MAYDRAPGVAFDNERYLAEQGEAILLCQGLIQFHNILKHFLDIHWCESNPFASRIHSGNTEQ